MFLTLYYTILFFYSGWQSSYLHMNTLFEVINIYLKFGDCLVFFYCDCLARNSVSSLSVDFFAVFLFADLSRRAKSKKLKCQTVGRRGVREVAGGAWRRVWCADNRTLIKFIYAALFVFILFYFIFVVVLFLMI